jgi:Immunity protein 26
MAPFITKRGKECSVDKEATMSKKKKIRRGQGDIVAIPLSHGAYGYGRVLREPLIAFYDLRSREILPLEDVLRFPVAFTLPVMNYPITDGSWPVVGNAPLTPNLLDEPLFFKKDPITGALTIYRDSSGEEISATKEQCAELECAAVWEPYHIIDRLQDHFSRRPNKWVDDLRP